MIEPWAIANTFVEHVRTSYPEDVALVVAYGSHVSGTPHDRSDLDIYFVPATERGREASLQFILDGIGYDFWPLGWERLEGIVRLNELPMIAAVVDALILYSRAKPDTMRFAALQARMRDQLHSSDLPVKLHRFDQILESATGHLGNLLGADATSTPSTSLMEANALVAEIVAGLALLNGEYLPRNWVQCRPQIRQFRLQPDGLPDFLDRFLKASSDEEIRESCRDLVEACWQFRKLFRARIPGDYPEHFAGFYEEIKSSINKVLHACDVGDHSLARAVSARLQHEIAWQLARVEESSVPGEMTPVSHFRTAYDRAGLPDITAIAIDGDLPRLSAAAGELDERFQTLLSNEGVEFTSFDSLDALHRHLNIEAHASGDTESAPESEETAPDQAPRDSQRKK
ncbi:MAG: hypothetical protein EA415_10895 [Sphaerobacteraceae bacterium]|nr:MAG: hypothetical protein EA415_10895 [Sphaerobacteraceae bacterium]